MSEAVSPVESAKKQSFAEPDADAAAQASALASQGDHLMALGDIAAARQFYLQALHAGATPKNGLLL